ncbi:MAG: helical backbone metal receptor, partial [Bacteroidota bacterium]
SLVGKLVNRLEEATAIKNKIENSFLNVNSKQKTVLYLIWKNPYMAAGNATFIGDMLLKTGLKNILSESENESVASLEVTKDLSRYPHLSIEDIKTLNPELIFLSSEPYPFKHQHINELQGLLPQAKIILVDGELFSWYGSRLLHSASYFNSLLEKL